jgi:hypothetical protein
MTHQMESMPDKKFRSLDRLVAVSFLVVVGISIAITLVGNQAWLESHKIIFGAVAIFECMLLLLWMLLGGQNSNLWSWLPPFCFFPKILWVRWFVIIGMVAGTLAGMILAKGN